MSLRIVWFITLVLSLAFAVPASARKWTDKTGKFSVEADLVKVEDGKAILKKANGKEIAVPVDRLSAVDRRYLATRMSPPNKLGIRPPKPQQSNPGGQPDLCVDRVFLNDAGFMRAQIRNAGAAQAIGVRVDFLVDGRQQATFGPTALAAGQEKVASAQRLPPGNHTVKVVMDAGNTIPETDESNNSMEVTLPQPAQSNRPLATKPQVVHESRPSAPSGTGALIPRLMEPPEDQTLPQPEDGAWQFAWTEVPGAIGYQIRVFRTGSKRPTIDSQTAEPTFTRPREPSHIIDRNLSGWQWRVRAQDKAGGWGSWSEPRQFSVAARVATTPTDPPVDDGDQPIPGGVQQSSDPKTLPRADSNQPTHGDELTLAPLVEPPVEETPNLLFASVVNGAAGLGSLGCFILVLVHMFQSDQKGLGVTCIVLVFVCGIGAMIAFVKGWTDGLGTVMWVWTGCIALTVLTNFVLTVGG